MSLTSSSFSKAIKNSFCAIYKTMSRKVFKRRTLTQFVRKEELKKKRQKSDKVPDVSTVNGVNP